MNNSKIYTLGNLPQKLDPVRNRYYEFMIANLPLNINDLENIPEVKEFYNLQYTLLKIFIDLSKKIKNKNWEYGAYATPYGYQAVVEDIDSGIKINLMPIEEGLLLDSFLNSTFNLHKMDDEFWYLVSELSYKFNVSFESELSLKELKNRKPAKILKSKSNVFSIIKNNVLLNFEDLGSDDIYIKYIWPFNTNWYDIFETGREIIERIYLINIKLLKKDKWKRFRTRI